MESYIFILLYFFHLFSAGEEEEESIEESSYTDVYIWNTQCSTRP